MIYGNTATPWPRVVSFYDELAKDDAGYRELANLARRVAESGFPAAGLHALTSMSDLLLGPSADVLDNPFLRVTYDPPSRCFLLTYEPGGHRMATREPRWSRAVPSEQAWPAIERFLTRRARWYRTERRQAGCDPRNA